MTTRQQQLDTAARIDRIGRPDADDPLDDLAEVLDGLRALLEAWRASR